MKKYLIIAVIFLTGAALAYGVDKGELVPLYPKSIKDGAQLDKQGPGTYWPMDPLYSIQHVDENAEYYLGSGAAGDTFFVVFETTRDCSVHYAEIQWYDGGTVDVFAAFYNYDARASYPLGQAPNRGESPVSPIGEWISDLYTTTAMGSWEWETVNIGEGFHTGNVFLSNKVTFGIGFVKNAVEPHVLADKMDSKGIRYTYSWFGGPWMATYPHDWGAYSSDLENGTVVEVMARVMVAWPWCPAGLIYIYDVAHQSNTFDQTGPFLITCSLEDYWEPAFGEQDTMSLVYRINNGDTIVVDLEEMDPPWEGSFGAYIDENLSVGDTISYWIYTYANNYDEWFNSTRDQPKSFTILEPLNPDADILIVQEGNTPQYLANLFNDMGVEYESWDLEQNQGIDLASLSFSWDAVLVNLSDSLCSITDDDLKPHFKEFLDSGGCLFYSDPALPMDSGVCVIEYEEGDFEYDYLGIETLYANPAEYDSVYYGVPENPVTGSFAENPLTTFPQSYDAPISNLAARDDCGALIGADNRFYAATVEDGFKVFHASFRLDVLNVPPDGEYSEDMFSLISNVLNWFEIPHLNVAKKPENAASTFVLMNNYPNPFNAETTISYNLSVKGEVKITVYNIYGQLVETLFDGYENSGHHQVKWEAGDLASGIYVCKLETESVNLSRKMLLLK